MLKKLLVTATFLAITGLAFPVSSYADDAQTCTQVTQYGGAVGFVCGAQTHAPVSTGIADNLPLVGTGFVGASAILTYFSRRIKKLS